MNNLNEKQQLFIEEYIINKFNATQAYINAYGVDSESARREGSRLLTNVDVRVVIDKRIDELLNNKKELTFQVVEEYKKIAFADLKNYIDPITGNNVINEETDTSVIESIQYDTLTSEKKGYERVRYKFKLYSKQTALDSISKLILGLAERHELTGKDGSDLFGSFIKNLGEE